MLLSLHCLLLLFLITNKDIEVGLPIILRLGTQLWHSQSLSLRFYFRAPL